MKQAVLERFGWEIASTVVEELQSGENVSLDVKTAVGRFVVHQFRQAVGQVLATTSNDWVGRSRRILQKR